MSSTAAEPNPPAAVRAGHAADSAEAVVERAGYAYQWSARLVNPTYG